MTREIEWLIDRLLDFYPNLEKITIQNRPEWTARDFLRARIIWGIPKGFTYFWTDKYGPFGGLLIRPVNDAMIQASWHDYWGTIWDYDPQGDICWGDFGCGPYSDFVNIFRSTGCKRLGWQHRNRMHIEPMGRINKIMHGFHRHRSAG